MKVEACLSPRLFEPQSATDAVVVVIDVLRATSAICTAFEHGVESVIPVASIEEAKSYKQQGYLVGAERDGKKVDGFDFGNSPYSYMGEELSGKTVVLTTTNGTRAIDIARDAAQVVVGAFTNFTALCKHLTTQQRDVILLCAGWKDHYNLEDAMFAGAVTEYLFKLKDRSHSFTDAALSAMYLFEAAFQDPYRFLRNSSHRRRLSALNLKKDIKYCLNYDHSQIIPVLHNGALVQLDEVKQAQPMTLDVS